MKFIDLIKTFISEADNFLLSIDNFCSKPSVKRINFFLVIVISFLAVFILNRLHPLFGDDWMYSMLPEPSNVRVKNFADILFTQYEHYFTWGGRSVVHIIAQSLLLMGKLPADILNSMAYVLLTLVIYRFANYGKKTNPALLIAINLLICIFQPAFGSTMLWKTGSANYLWGTLIMFSFMLPYRIYLKKEGRDNYWATFLMFIGGIIAGWTNENMAVALVLMLIMFICFYKYKNMRLPKWALSGLAGAAVGCVVMIAAPGNYNRMDMIQADQNIPLIPILFKQFIQSLSSYYYYCLELTLILLLVWAVYKYYADEKNKSIDKYTALIIFSGAIIATLAMSGSPIFPGRAAYGINTLLILSISLLFANLNFSDSLIKKLSVIAISFGLLFFGASYHRGFRELSAANTILKERIAFVEKNIDEGKKFIEFNKIVKSPETKFFHYFEITPSVDDWHNKTFSRYYDLDSVKLIP